MSNYFDLHRTRDFGRKLNAIVEFIRYNSKPFSKAMLFVAGPFILLGSVLITHFMNLYMTMTANIAGGGTFNTDFWTAGSLVSLVLGAFVLIIGSIVLITTVFSYVILYDQKKSNEISVNEVWTLVKSNVWKILGSLLAFLAISIGLYILLILLMGLLAVIHPLLIFIAFIAIFIAILFLSALFFLTLFVQVYEKLGITAAVNRALFLIRENWWSTVAIIIVTSILQSIISSAFIIPMYINIFVYAFHSAEGGGTMDDPSLTFQIINYVSLAFYMLASYLFYMLPLLGIVFQYFNLTEKKEAKGLMDRLETFGTTPNVTDGDEHY
jgi:hypothetical protein